MSAVKFQKFYVATADNKIKVKVWYSLDNRCDGRKCVTVYASEYGHDLAKVLPNNYKNETDIQTDYFDKGKSVIFEGDENYAAARARAEQNEADRIAKRSAPKKVESFEVTSVEENVWETTVRGIRYKITYRFKPGYLMWLVQSYNPQARFGHGKAKWVRTPNDIESVFPRLRGIAVKIAAPENCVAFPVKGN